MVIDNLLIANGLG